MTLSVSIGNIYNRFTVIDVTRRNGRKHFVCRCSCGNVKNVTASQLVSGGTKSCGCLNNEMRKATASTRTLKHGMSRTTEYNSWAEMVRRCSDINCINFKYYGGRGITVCDRWMTSFENFIADMGLKPSQSHSIDRIDNDFGYSPDNCRWATRAEQAANRRSTKQYYFGNEKLTILEISSKIGVKPFTIRSRLLKGWSEFESFKK